MSYVITTDTTTDLPEEYYQKHELQVLSLSYVLDGETYFRGGKELSSGEFYAKMRNGSMPTTSQVNPENAKAVFEPIVREGKDIVHIAFSSGLSGSCNSARIAAEELMEDYPERKIYVVDSLCASLGEGLLVHKALQKKEEGLGAQELAQWCEEHRLNVIHSFTVDDLFHLYRGGRVSKVAAVVGTMISLKPVLHVNDEGKLIPLSKVRRRKKSLEALVDAMAEKQGSYAGKNDIVFISHGDCLKDAEYVKSLVQERFGIKEFIIHPVGPVIGAHSGPGTVALFFMGDHR
ncbi:MAG: DegV family protein [Eubacteriales bacterium]|nr:DegV family protein [Eubacteriales bacterium]